MIGTRPERTICELVGELGGEVSGVPVLPSFDKLAVFDADHGSAGDLHAPLGGLVDELSRPVHTGERAFGKRNERRDTEVGEFRAKLVVKDREFVRTAHLLSAVVEYAIASKELIDSFAASLVPDLLKPAGHKVFLLL